MQRQMLKSKIFRATITDAHLDYEGSLSLGPDLREAADLLLGEKVLVVNNNNGSRLETYVLDGSNGEVCLNGAAARLGEIGDIVIIMAFAVVDNREAETMKPRIVYVDGNNNIIRRT